MSRRPRRKQAQAGVRGVVVFIVIALVLVWLFWDRIPGLNTVPRPDQASRPGASPSPVATGPYEVYFTTPTYPDRPETRRGGIDEKFVAYVDAATKTLDIAAYEFDLENVAQAMTRAKARGVQVRMVTDSDTVNAVRDEATQKALKIVRDAGITIVPDGRSPIMHHKFAVRDGEEIWTGSFTFPRGRPAPNFFRTNIVSNSSVYAFASSGERIRTALLLRR